MDGMHFADQTGIMNLFTGSHSVTGTSLVSHLGHDLVFFCGFGQLSGFPNVMSEGLLGVHVFSQFHRSQGGYSVRMVRCGYRTSIDIISFLVQHLAKIVVILRLGVIASGIGSPIVIDVTQGHYVHVPAFYKTGKVRPAFPSGTDPGYVQFVTGGRVSFPTHYMAGDDHKARGSNRCGFEEISSRIIFVW